MSSPHPESAIAAIRAWYALDQAIRGADAHLRQCHGLTGGQLALLRILGEHDSWLLRDLRRQLSMHPATLGQQLDRLVKRGLVATENDDADGRRKRVFATPQGRSMLTTAPVIGPVRLRSADIPTEDLTAMARGFLLARQHFGLEATNERQPS